MVYDFHTHTFLSDGELSPVELARRAHVNKYKALAITDHAGIGSLERILKELTEDCALASREWDIQVLPGVELTHVPLARLSQIAKRARELGARIVVVHGETIVEPVEEGTNRAALESPYVDVLAHPGLLTPELAALAAQKGIFLELSARRGHSLTNGHVANLALAKGAPLLLNSDAHSLEDLLSEQLARNIIRGAGLSDQQIHWVMTTNPEALLNRLRNRSMRAPGP